MENQEKSISILSGAGVLPAFTASGVVTTRAGLVVQHMLAASRFARRVAEVEREHAGEEFGEFFEEIIHNATASVLFSVASVETNINEIFVDAHKHLPEDKHNLVDWVWDTFNRRPSILDKYEAMRLLKTGKKPDKGVGVYQAMDTLISVRNALVHFVPEWANDLKEHEKIAKRLRSSNVVSPFHAPNPIFPSSFMSYALANWAVRSSVTFMAEFSTQTGLSDKLRGHSEQILA